MLFASNASPEPKSMTTFPFNWVKRIFPEESLQLHVATLEIPRVVHRLMT
jgi:hypothetical protein